MNNIVLFLAQRILDGKLNFEDIPDGSIKREIKEYLKELGYNELII